VTRTAFHYTTGEHLPRILKAKRLNLEVGMTIGKNERMACWFTTGDHYEPTALKAMTNHKGAKVDFKTAAEQAPFTKGLVRIAVPISRLKPYGYWVDHSGVHPQMLKAMEKSARMKGVDFERLWYVSFKPVPSTAWLSVELSDDDETWTPCPEAAGILNSRRGF